MVGKLRVGDDGFADIGIDGTIVGLQSFKLCRFAFPTGLRRGSGCRATKLELEACEENPGRDVRRSESTFRRGSGEI